MKYLHRYNKGYKLLSTSIRPSLLSNKKTYTIDSLNHIKDILDNIFGNVIYSKIEQPHNNIDRIIFNLPMYHRNYNMPETSISLFILEDDYYILRILLNNETYHLKDLVFECDQEEGLIALLEKIKSIMPDYNIDSKNIISRNKILNINNISKDIKSKAIETLYTLRQKYDKIITDLFSGKINI